MTRPPGQRFDPTAEPPPDPNAGATVQSVNEVDIKVAGRSNLYIGSLGGATNYNELFYFGEQIDDTPIVNREFYNDVPGDSHGGPQGPPIERQTLGKIIQVTFTLSAWNQGLRANLENHNGTYATSGRVEDYEIGELQFRRRGFRVLVVPLKDNPLDAADPLPIDKSRDWFTFNFPCAQLSTPIECGQGTKFSVLRFTMEAHRAPPGHAQRNIIWNRDITGLETAEVRRQEMLVGQMAELEEE